MRLKVSLILVLLMGMLAYGGCSSIPPSYPNTDTVYETGEGREQYVKYRLGYKIESENDEGFFIEIAMVISSLESTSDTLDLINKLVKESIEKESKKRGRQVIILTISHMNVFTILNINDLFLTVFVSGEIEYK